ncbi:OpgC domain-containing protein [Pseudomonas putida]|uniref:OpgC domain-containing protein n=1 Tax=Pseudomonas putida TaxID=303 RepID=UPI0009A152AD|nr:OpgC domain-containing protein [Pseudomonas putida]
MNNGRDLRIDFFRGVALVFIFWDHIPDNPLGNITVRNIGFSDAAEIFVFLAGYAAVLAYGKVARRDGWLVASMRILRRVWVLYVAHIFLLALLMGMVFVANHHAQRDMVEGMGLSYFLHDPQQALVDELMLRFKPNLMDPLPLYILLLLGLPLLLPLLMQRMALAVGLSLGFYALVQVFKWNLPAQEGGVWYFNPLAWQLLFVLGGAAAVHGQRRPSAPAPVAWRQPLFVGTATIVLISALVTLSWRWTALHDVLIPRWLGEWLYPIDKTNLSPLRLVQFLALAYCTARLVPCGPWLGGWVARQSCRMGRYSLEVFCLGVLLAPMADMFNAMGGDRWPVQLLTALGGLLAMLLLAGWLEWNKQLGQPIVAPVIAGQGAA